MKLSQNKCCKSDIPTAMVKADIMAKKVTASINKAMIKNHFHHVLVLSREAVHPGWWLLSCAPQHHTTASTTFTLGVPITRSKSASPSVGSTPNIQQTFPDIPRNQEAKRMCSKAINSFILASSQR